MSAAVPHTSGPDDDPRQALRLADLITTLQGNLLNIGVGNAIIASGLTAALHDVVPLSVLAPWLVLQLLHSGFNVWAWWRVRSRPVKARHARQRARACEWASLASSLLWALPLPWLWPAGRLDLQLLILTLLTGLTSGAIHSLSAHVRAFAWFMGPIVAAVVGQCLWQGDTVHLVIAATALVYGITSLRFAVAMHALQLRSLRQRDELADLAADLQHQKDRAEQASLGKTRFLAAASHDIRQPVHTLGLFLGAFDDAALSGRNAALIGPLRASARGLREMLDSVLDLSRADAGALQAELSALPLQPLLEALERDFAPLAEAKGLVLRMVPTRAWARADPALLDRVLRNLVSNAVHYTARGGVLVGVRRRGARLQLDVWDTGPGIEPAEQGRLFDEFSRGPQAAQVAPQGLGLGLAIARRFAAAMGAGLSLASRPGRGSVFRVVLEAAAAPLARPIAGASAGAMAASNGLLGLRVLLVDDDPGVREATGLLLSDWGCNVQALDSPDQLHPDQPLPDVALTDNQFAGRLRAHEVAAWLNRRGAGHVPLLVLTGDTQADNLAPLTASGARVLGKPLEPAVLQDALVALRARC